MAQLTGHGVNGERKRLTGLVMAHWQPAAEKRGRTKAARMKSMEEVQRLRVPGVAQVLQSFFQLRSTAFRWAQIDQIRVRGGGGGGQGQDRG